MIGAFEDAGHPDHTDVPYRAYGLSLEHKHTEEMRVHMGLDQRPVFVPSVGKYYKGMLVFVPLQLWGLPGSVSVAQVSDALHARYDGAAHVKVLSGGDVDEIKTLSPEACNDTNDMNLYVFGNEARRQAVLVAQLDNLGKGASGAAVQSLDIILASR